jgi:hypothetical protein
MPSKQAVSTGKECSETVTGQDKSEEGTERTTRTFVHYDTVSNDPNLVHLVTHCPIIEYFVIFGGRRKPQFLLGCVRLWYDHVE